MPTNTPTRTTTPRLLSLLIILTSLTACAYFGLSAWTTFQSTIPLRSQLQDLSSVPNITKSPLRLLQSKEQALQPLEALSANYSVSSTSQPLHPLAPQAQLLTATLSSTTPLNNPNPVLQPLISAGWSPVSVSSSVNPPSTSIILQKPVTTGATK